MSSVRKEFNQFLDKNFTRLQLKPPLFYRWPVGIRFDLQVDDPEEEGYFDTVNNRSTSLFKQAFASSDKLFLVLTDYAYRRRKIRSSNYVFQQVSQLTKGEINHTKVKSYCQSENKLVIRNVAIVELTTERLNYRNILLAISNTDFEARQPRLDKYDFFSSKRVYFLNATKKLIFHMYDDRGLDIIATSIETLRPIYEHYNRWILAHNREQIDRLFLR